MFHNIPRACLINRSPVPAMDLKSNRSGLRRHMLKTCHRLRRLCYRRSNNVARHDKTPVESTLLSRDMLKLQTDIENLCTWRCNNISSFNNYSMSNTANSEFFFHFRCQHFPEFHISNLKSCWLLDRKAHLFFFPTWDSDQCTVKIEFHSVRG